jgi:hypothetical protein
MEAEISGRRMGEIREKENYYGPLSVRIIDLNLFLEQSYNVDHQMVCIFLSIKIRL